jgi:ABC-type phosphate transport system auxiliary subunit
MPFFRMRKIKSHRKAAKNAREYFLYLLRLEKEYTEVTEKDRNTETPKHRNLLIFKDSNG